MFPLTWGRGLDPRSKPHIFLWERDRKFVVVSTHFWLVKIVNVGLVKLVLFRLVICSKLVKIVHVGLVKLVLFRLAVCSKLVKVITVRLVKLTLLKLVIFSRSS